MNRALTTQETNALLAAFPFPSMTRRDKLQRWADLIRSTPEMLCLYHLLEHRRQEWDSMNHDHTAFARAFADPVLRDAGLKSASVGDSMRFFELSQDELHAFSCDCGGHITNREMADRIERIAQGRPAIDLWTPSEAMRRFASALIGR